MSTKAEPTAWTARREMIAAFAILKKAAATANRAGERLDDQAREPCPGSTSGR